MKSKMKILSLAVFLLIVGLSSCDKYLDVMPDMRTEVDTPRKIADLLVSAYPERCYRSFCEVMTDNVIDNGEINGQPVFVLDRFYEFGNSDVVDNTDTPQGIWNFSYMAIAAANHALEKIEELGSPKECLGSKAEALLCRAYNHFILVKIFSNVYNEASAGTDLGIPYVKNMEKRPGVHYDRGSVKAVYENIDADIEEALKFINEVKYAIPTYHFNKKAAYAFASEFNLFYQKYDKAIEYANEVLGDNPISVLRDLRNYTGLSNYRAWIIRYVDDKDPANLMLTASYSTWSGKLGNKRLGHNRSILNNETVGSRFPGNGYLTVYNTIYGHNEASMVPKIGSLGGTRVINYDFTTDKTLLNRAEAKVMMKEYEAAAKDLSYWYEVKGATPNLNAQTIADFYQEADKATICKPLNPYFSVESGMQENMIQAVLHARRAETVHEADRFFDIKRYGIEIKHSLADGSVVVLKPHDLRTWIQIPPNSLIAGVQPNPRDVE